MKISAAAIYLGALAGLVGAKPVQPVNMRDGFNASLNDGYPNPSDQQALDIAKVADGTLPNAPPPQSLSNISLTAFQLIAFNENFEVAFFQSMLNNLTNGSYNQELPNQGLRDNLAKVITTIRAVCLSPP